MGLSVSPCFYIQRCGKLQVFYSTIFLQYTIYSKCYKFDKHKKVPEHLVIAHMPDTPLFPLCWLALVSSLLSHVDEDQ